MYNVAIEGDAWYYMTGNGKYAHTSSMRLMADAFCRKHADEVVNMLASNDVRATLESTRETACVICLQNEKDEAQ